MEIWLPPLGRRMQCDQMVRLFDQNLAIYNKENLPNSKFLAPKKVQFSAIYSMNTQKLTNTFERLAQLAKFCHIWSHWSDGMCRRIEWTKAVLLSDCFLVEKKKVENSPLDVRVQCEQIGRNFNSIW